MDMQTMEQSLEELYLAGKISLETALYSAKSPDLIRHRLMDGENNKRAGLGKVIAPQAFAKKK
jgi:Tfp pilus assembly ATPase PilU